MLTWIGARLKEPSTYAGLAGMLTALGLLYPPWAPFLHNLAIMLGGVAVVKADK